MALQLSATTERELPLPLPLPPFPACSSEMCAAPCVLDSDLMSVQAEAKQTLTSE